MKRDDPPRLRRPLADLSRMLGGLLAASVGLGLVASTAPPARGDRGIETPTSRLGEPLSTTLRAPDGAPLVASYELSGRLDEDLHRIAATGLIHWQNTSQHPVNELWFHLYLNAFSHDQSLFLRSPGGRQRGTPNVWGGLTVNRLVIREIGSRDLWPRAASHSPGDPDDATDIRLPLPRSVQPGENLTLEVDFEAQLPDLFERTGFVDSFHFVAQWFPKLARLEPDGTWAHFPFHPQAEFYADFGDYDITLDVPTAMVIGATGQRLDRQVSGDRQLVRYRARGVHDFAWTAWDGFQEHREKIGTTEVRLLYPQGQELNQERAIAVLRRALPDLAQRYGAYPYPTLTVVHPPWNARAAGGMEYPTLITTGAPWYAPYVSRAIETVTVHELAHQWFYGIIATNEPAAPVLDEGLTTWAESLTLRRYFGSASALQLPGLIVSAEAVRRAYTAQHVHDDIVVQPAAQFTDYSSIGALVYAKTGTVLRTIANVYGEDRVERALGAYAREHRFQHPTWQNLLDAFERHVGSDATQQLKLALEGRGWVNYTGEQPRCRQLDAPTADTHQCTVRVRRHGPLQFPVNVDLVLDDASRVSHRWDGHGPSHVIQHQGARRVVGVVVDPEVAITLDSNLLDNAASTRHDSMPRAVGQTTFLVQSILGWVGP